MNLRYGPVATICCFFLVYIAVFTGCRKLDKETLPETPEKPLTMEERFFKISSTAPSSVKAINQSVFRQHEKDRFVNNLVSHIGFPNWDKVMVATSSGIMRTESGGDTIEVAYIPFAIPDSNVTSAVLAVGLSPSDTMYNLLFPERYQQFGFDTTAQGWNSRDLFHLFATFDYTMFGTTTHIITDGRIFGKESDDTLMVKRADQVSGRAGVVTDYWDMACDRYILYAKTTPAQGRAAGSTGLITNTVVAPEPVGEVTICTAYWVQTGGGVTMPGDGPGPLNGGGGNNPSGPWQQMEPCPVDPRRSTVGTDAGLIIPCGAGWVSVTTTYYPPLSPEPIDSMLARYYRSIQPRTDSLLQKSLAYNWEHSMIIVKKGYSIYLKNEKTSQDSLSTEVDFRLDPGELLLGYIHCHSSASSNENDRSAPSGADITDLKRRLSLNFVQITECGNAAYALVVEDVNKARDLLNVITRQDLNERLMNSALQQPGWFSDWQRATLSVGVSIIGPSNQSGIGFYKSNDPARQNWVKQN